MPFADLHAHTTASDGVLAPRDLVRMAAERHLAVVAVTDHDTVAGLPEALEAGAAHGVRVIPGVEISCEINLRELHVLGLFVDPGSAPLVALLDAARAERERVARKVLERLAVCKVPVELEEVRKFAGGQTLGRPHFARALLARGHVRTFAEAFDRYLGDDRPAHVYRQRPAVAAACSAIEHAGGLPVLAHPGGSPGALSRERIQALAREGILGLEVDHPAHEPRLVQRYRRMAADLGLVPTAGSDFHGTREGAPLGTRGLDQVGFEAVTARLQSR